MKMKTLYLISIIFLLFWGCKKDLIEQLPSDISKLIPVDHVVDSLNYVFSENGNALLESPYLFSDTIQKNIVLIKESNVYVTFIDEGTDKKNTLCWYSYNISQPPVNVSDIRGHILFPNISKIGEGGLLELGYTVQLGTNKFPAGTVIGFYLIAGGWNDGTINYEANTIYTDYKFNVGGEQLHILFKNLYSHYLIMGFEDNLIGTHDFNDVLFEVSDNNSGYESTAFDLSKVYIR
jgi:hypothetical protein